MDTHIAAAATPSVTASQASVDPQEDAKKLYAMLQPMALMGMQGTLLAIMLGLNAELTGVKVPGFRLRFLGGPIICHSRSFDLKNHPLGSNEAFQGFISADRLKWALDLTPMPVGPTELAMIMYEASLEAPFKDSLAELYIWASATAMYRINQSGLEHLGEISKRFPPDREPEQILDDPMMKMTYFGLANEIQRKVLAANHGN